MSNIKRILYVILIFYGWSIWCINIYDHNIPNTVEQVIYFLQGFEGFDKKCMGWILIHMPIQLYLTFRMVKYLDAFSIYYYMRKGKITKLWMEQFVTTLKIAFLYYSFGFIIVFTQFNLHKYAVLLNTKSIVLILAACTILSISCASFTFLVLFAKAMVSNFQAAFTIVLILQFILVVISQLKELNIILIPLSHTNIYRQILIPKKFLALLFQAIIELSIITFAGWIVTKKRFEKIFANE